MTKRLSLYIPTMNGGGAEKVFATLANYWVSKGYVVDLVLSRAEGVYLSILDDKVNVINLGSSRVLQDTVKLRKYLKLNKPDIIYSALPHCNIMSVFVTRLLKDKPLVVIGEHSNVNIKLGTRGERLFRFLQKFFYRKADKIITVSDGIMNEYITLLSISPNIFKTIYNPAFSLDNLRLSYEKPSHPWFSLGVPIILSVARLEEVKDYPTLIKAFSRVREEIDAKLIVLGEGSERRKLEELIQKMGLCDDIDLAGFVDNPHAYMRASDLFVLSSKREGFGNVIVEAMACGTHVVSTDCSGPSEILENGKWGRIVPVGNVEALAESIKESIKNPLKVDVTKRAKDFSIEKISQEYLSVLDV